MSRRGVAVAVAAVAALSAAGCGSERAALVPVPPVSVPLSGPWRFAVDPRRDGVWAGWFRTAFRDAGWQTVVVPHTWNVMPAHRDYSGLAWYRRSFALPAREVRDAHLRLRFEAVFYAARVWMNGRELGRHEGGYTPFELDATSAAKAGRNVVAVLVDNRRAADRIPADITPGWSFDWWNYGGIVRDVSLAVTSRAYVAGQRIVAVPHLTGRDEADTAAVGVAVRVANDSGRELREVLTRPVHYPQSPLVLDYADRHGILLIPEVPAWQLTRDQMANPLMQALEQRQLREMIESEADHPSVIAWSVGNELDGTRPGPRRVPGRARDRVGVRARAPLVRVRRVG